MLFSEPKIPQSNQQRVEYSLMLGFSALQRAENSSIQYPNIVVIRSAKFQCSSASRKFLNRSVDERQRRFAHVFQCSSASRKFLNEIGTLIECSGRSVSVLFSEPKIPQYFLITSSARMRLSFSALQRAENSSIEFFEHRRFRLSITFQCSSASRKFLNISSALEGSCGYCVSVLFSEPKIPQSFWINLALEE